MGHSHLSRHVLADFGPVCDVHVRISAHSQLSHLSGTKEEDWSPELLELPININGTDGSLCVPSYAEPQNPSQNPLCIVQGPGCQDSVVSEYGLASPILG